MRALRQRTDADMHPAPMRSLWDTCKWASIPVVAIVAFLLLGIKEVGGAAQRLLAASCKLPSAVLVPSCALLPASCLRSALRGCERCHKSQAFPPWPRLPSLHADWPVHRGAVQHPGEAPLLLTPLLVLAPRGAARQALAAACKQQHNVYVRAFPPPVAAPGEDL